jgi:glycosyltransferase involved in cell wall biosynthesis
MDINIFILCYNESALLPHTIKHYKKNLPGCKITIYDNESSDNSVEIAKELGCSVISWNSNNYIDDYKYIEIKNNCWKSIKNGWIIMADMDELLCVTTDDLEKEMNNSVSLLTIKGIELLADCKTIDLTDLDVDKVKKYVDNPGESKSLCFLREKIEEMNYSLGAHSCNPKGYISYSSTTYINKHLSAPGLKFFTNKMIERSKRATLMHSKGIATHYISDITAIENMYNSGINQYKLLD